MNLRKLFLSMFLAVFVVCSPLSAFAESSQDSSDSPQQTTLAQYEEAKELATTQENVTVVEFRYHEDENKVTVTPSGTVTPSSGFGSGQLLAWGTLTTSKNSSYAYADLVVTTTIFGQTISMLNGVFTWNGTTFDRAQQFLSPPSATTREQSQLSLANKPSSGIVDFYGSVTVNGTIATLDVPISAGY